MPAAHSSPPPVPRARARDVGFTLVEVMAAMAVMAVLLTAASVLLVKSFQTTGSDRQRVRAASIAAQEVDRVRGLMQNDPLAISTQSSTDLVHTVTNLTSTLFTVASKQAVGGTAFTVLDNGTWQSASSFNGLLLSVTVSWPNMAGVKPVVNSAVLATLNTGGSGANGTIVTVSPAPTSSAAPVTTLSPSCSLQTGVASVIVNSSVAAPGGTYTALWDNSTIPGIVTAQATGSNPCGTTTNVALTYAGSGSYLAVLPYGTWALTAKLNDGSLLTENVTVSSAATTAPTLTVWDNCGGAPSVQYNVSSSLLGQIVGAVVTGSRSSSGTNGSICSVPVPSTTFTTIVGGLFTGNTAYGNWTFAAAPSLFSGPVSATTTVGSAATTVNLTDSGCPSISEPVTLTVNQTANVLGVASSLLATGGTITATRTGPSGCGSATQPLTVNSNGVASGTLGYGNWTLSGTGTGLSGSTSGTVSDTLAVSTSAVTKTVSAAVGCPASQHVVVTPKHGILSLLGVVSGTMASVTGDVCHPAGVSAAGVSLLGGSATLNLVPGSWTFTDAELLATYHSAATAVTSSTNSLTLSVS